MSRPSENQPAQPFSPSNEPYVMTEEERELRALFPHVARESTDECRGPEDFLQLAEMGENHHDNREIFCHVLGCAYCMREYREVCRDLLELKRLSNRSTAEPLPTDGTAVDKTESQEVRPSIQPFANEWDAASRKETPARSWRDWFRLSVLLPALATGAATALFVWFARVDPLIRDVRQARREANAAATKSVELAATLDTLNRQLTKFEKQGTGTPAHILDITPDGPAPVFDNLMGGGGPATPPVTGLSPVGKSSILEERPRLSWDPVPKSVQYHVALHDPDNPLMVYDAGATPLPTFELRKSLPPRRKVVWTVEARGAKGLLLARGQGRFWTGSEEHRRAAERAHDASHIALAEAFRRKGFLDEAIRELRAVPRGSARYAEAQKRLNEIMQ